MFTHKEYDKYSFEEIPLDQDIFLMRESHASAYNEMMCAFFDGGEWEPTGTVSYFAAREIKDDQIEMSWFSNIADRFHEINVHLPKSEFVACVGHRSSDEKVHVFVRDEWIESLYANNYSTFALIDIANFRTALAKGAIEPEGLIDFRDRLDQIAKENSNHALISFADSVLIKANWTVGSKKKDIPNTYKPEDIIFVARQIIEAYSETLNVPSYCIISQGENRFYGNELMHLSESQNHVSLNSLGIPFEQTQAIESAARSAIREKKHSHFNLYLESTFLHSLDLKFRSTIKQAESFPYRSKMLEGIGEYHPVDIYRLISELETKPNQSGDDNSE